MWTVCLPFTVCVMTVRKWVPREGLTRRVSLRVIMQLRYLGGQVVSSVPTWTESWVGAYEFYSSSTVSSRYESVRVFMSGLTCVTILGSVCLILWCYSLLSLVVAGARLLVA